MLSRGALYVVHTGGKQYFTDVQTKTIYISFFVPLKDKLYSIANLHYIFPSLFLDEMWSKLPSI